MIAIHHLNSSRSHRIVWLMEELGLPYELVKYQRDPQTRLAPPELQRVNPLGKSPAIVDNGRTDIEPSSDGVAEPDEALAPAGAGGEPRLTSEDV